MSEMERLHLDVGRQELIGFLRSNEMLRFTVSPAARGLGCGEGSFQTPHGAHRVRLKIGAALPPGQFFEAAA